MIGRRKRLSGPSSQHPEAPRIAMIVMVQKGTSHETAVAAAAQAGARLSLLVPDTTGQDRLLIRNPAKAWRDNEQRGTDVRITSLRHIQRAVDVARASGITYEAAHLDGGRVVIFEPLPSFAACPQVVRTAPLVLDLPRDPVAFYAHALDRNEGRSRPVLAFSVRESKGSALAIGLAANVAVTARHHLDCRYEGPRAFVPLDHLDRWREDNFRTEVTFTPVNDSGADITIGLRTCT